jgi:hypothetical protein
LEGIPGSNRLASVCSAVTGHDAAKLEVHLPAAGGNAGVHETLLGKVPDKVKAATEAAAF